MRVMFVLLGLAIAGASAMLWWPRDAAPAPMPPTATRDEGAAIATATPPNDAASEAANDPAPLRREIVDAPPGIDDFAPEQRAAVRELLEASRPTPEQIAAAEAILAKMAPDAIQRRVLALACLPDAAIVRCAVLAVRERAIDVKLQSSPPELVAKAGERLVLTRAVPREQAAILSRHALPQPAVVEAGKVHTLLVMRHPLAPGVGVICLCASPALGIAGIEPAADADDGGAADEAALLLDFPAAERDAVRELLAGRSTIWSRQGDGKIAGSCGLVRCRAERLAFGGFGWRAMVSQQALGIDVDDAISATSHLVPMVRSEHGLPAGTEVADGEVRTLVMWRSQIFGVPYKLFILLESPPLKQ